jgi:hypothetical protein
LLTYAVVFLIAFGLNLLPVFTPPTWTVLAFFHIRWGLDLWILAAGGAAAAAGGRFVLAKAASGLVRYFPKKYADNVEYLRGYLKKKEAAATGFAFFYAAVLPVSSSQFFVAVGLARLNLAFILPAFFVGRFISYALLGYSAGLVASRLDKLFAKYYGNGLVIVLEVLSILILWLLVKIDWRVLVEKRKLSFR